MGDPPPENEEIRTRCLRRYCGDSNGVVDGIITKIGQLEYVPEVIEVHIIAPTDTFFIKVYF